MTVSTERVSPFPYPIVLASASPRRHDLLAAAGVLFEIVVAAAEEVAPPHLTVAEATLLNAKRKAEAVCRQRPEAIVIGADTLVALDGEPLGKPRHLEEAHAMLTQLSGRTHEVFSGVWLVHAARNRTRGFVEVSRVSFRKISPAEIDRYFTVVDPLDKAGGYAAQQDPIGLIAKISGSRSNVIGLPMERLRQTLASFR